MSSFTIGAKERAYGPIGEREMYPEMGKDKSGIEKAGIFKEGRTWLEGGKIAGLCWMSGFRNPKTFFSAPTSPEWVGARKWP